MDGQDGFCDNDRAGRKLPTDPNYITISTQTSTGAFAARNFSYNDDLTAVPNGLIKYRLKMNIAADSSFYLDSATVNHSQNCSPQPVLTASGLGNFGAVCTGSSSTAGSFTITGTNLPAGNVVVSALSGYSFSTTIGGTYTASLSLSQPGGSYSQIIYVKFTPTSASSYNGNITVSIGSSTVLVAATGSGIAVLPAMTTGAASAITSSGAKLAGQIVITNCGPVSAYGIDYSTINGFANGTGTRVASNNVNAGNYSVNLSGLAANTTYYYKAFGTNLSGTAFGSQLSFKTLAAASGLIIYNSPVSHNSSLHYSTYGISAGRYGVRIVNGAGQIVYRKEMDVTGTFIDESIILPAYMSTGVYTLQVTGNGVKQKKSFIVN